ncbi:outer membrane protein assembly factor BamA [Malaciobacter mytili LMG 24559]|uniref:Outer membrane protein assembly factor BamA n=1 Tax=Malaciobacter mytili LMG 24559 TaxID=1032238 RepID=A0AAX2AI88_9BACT|nr:outer membrane protein assembly factor BamA [Malaciobacter mytili]AXH15044.1 beta-barrel assembly machinery complex, BamA/YaeT protein [Malaciobacter mytili LMG 24559]RXK16727.1 outer membrane protein assembly factor BamA [Malaciobacter mytili LMG 24559]
MKKRLTLLSITLASLLHAEQINSIEYINLTKISSQIANETLNLKVGDDLDIIKVNNAIKEFYKFGYFDDISVNSNNGILQFTFQEKPSIANLEITGYKTREEDIQSLKVLMGLRKGSMYSPQKAKEAKEVLLTELEKEGYINSIVEIEVEQINESSVSLIFNVNKGDEIIIKKVNYIGAQNLENDDFENVTANKEKEFASWFFGRNDGELKLDHLPYESARISELYFQNGYLDVKVKDPFLKVDFASNQAKLDFFIEEGKQYTTNSIKIYIDESILKSETLYPELSLKKDRVFNISKLRKDVDYIKTQISDLGYAFAQIKYDINKNEKDSTADIVFNVIPGQKVYINDVKISGNARTLDRVIRRNVYLAPGDLFSLTDFKDSVSKLKRTGYFDDVQIQQKRITEDKMDLVVEVVEARTGNIILGGGYGSYDKMMVNASINDNNIFGSGLSVGLSTELSSKESMFQFNLRNPAIADSKYNGDIEIHNTDTEITRDNYELNKKSTGFSIGAGKEFFRNFYAGARYRLDFIKEEYDYDDDFIKKSSKKYYEDTDYVTSSITPYINFNNTDDFYLPRSGFKAGTSLEFAGLGGDSKYIKSSTYFKYFYSLQNALDLDWILRYKADLRMLIDNGQINQGDSLYLGGPKTLRGFKSYAFGPNNDDGEYEDPYKRMFSNSVELSFPLVPTAKMRWGVFYDYGMIGEDNFNDINRSATGALFEWVSPVGPLQLIFAKPIDDKSGDDTSSFEFSLGSSF